MTAPLAVVLLSGGLDSATVLAVAGDEGFRIHALTFDYAQRAKAEIEAAGRLAAAAEVERHVLVPFSLRGLVQSALTSDQPVPSKEEATLRHGIPETYVPARNTIFLSIALGYAESIGAHDIFIGANALDYSGYPDCRPEYLDAFNRLAALATAEGAAGGRPIRIQAPILKLSKADIIRLGNDLGVDFGLTVSCYDPDEQGKACGRCESCTIRLAGFAEAKLEDPVVYR